MTTAIVYPIDNYERWSHVSWRGIAYAMILTNDGLVIQYPMGDRDFITQVRTCELPTVLHAHFGIPNQPREVRGGCLAYIEGPTLANDNKRMTVV